MLKWTLFAEQHNLPSLRRICERYIMLHYQEVANDPLLQQVQLDLRSFPCSPCVYASLWWVQKYCCRAVDAKHWQPTIANACQHSVWQQISDAIRHDAYSIHHSHTAKGPQDGMRK
jgi:hypothetical protein